MTDLSRAESKARSRKWFGLIAIALGVSMIVVDTTIVNVITPSVIDDLGINSTQAQWVQESYAIVFAALLLISGRVADIVGARLLFVIGVVVFGATSLFAGLAQTGDLLILARFLQGVGGAMLLPTSLSLLNQSFTGKARNQAFAVWGSTIGAATAVGPVIGGWLSEHASWRWAFGINVPIVILILVLAFAFIAPSPRKPGRIDVLGALLSMVGLAALAFGLVEGRTYGWITSKAPFDLFGTTWDGGISPVFVALIVAAVFLALFVWRQIRLSSPANPGEPLMNTRLFSIASFRNGNIATLIIGLGEFGVIAVIPLWLQFTLGYTPLQAGIALLPVAVGSFVASGLSFGLADRLGALGLVRIGLVLEAVGLVVLALVARTDSPWWAIAIPLFLYGIGVGFATAQVTNVVLADVPDADAGQASGVQSTFRQLGSALGIAALTTVFYSVLGGHVTSALKDHGGLSGAQIDKFTSAVTDSAGAVIQSFAHNPATRFVAHAAEQGMTSGVTIASFVAAGFLVLGVIATALIPARKGASADSANG